MVAQRIASDFQLVQREGDQMSGSHRIAHGAALGSTGRVLYTLSMGHRIHVISYDEKAMRVDVKVYTSADSTPSRQTTTDPVNGNMCVRDRATNCHSSRRTVQVRVPLQLVA